MASIGDLYFGFHGEDSGLQLDATKAGQSAGEKAGGMFSSAFGTVVKVAASAVIGVGIGMALKAITTSAVELDAATRKYAADTGATVAETKLAGEQINNLFKTNVEGYAVIGEVLSKLRTDLHVTGTAAQGLAQEFLHYALATGQEPVAATEALTTAIKAWKVPADGIPALMDQIVAGHQKYGGSVSENVAVLAKLAPALTAANIGLDTATGLLNLFAASGLDSEKAATAFTKAIGKVHSPEQLQTMIEKIQNTTDGFDRAKLAIALFGAKAGPQLAEALAPGTKSLADYTVTASQSAGATDKAAEAIDQGFGNQAVLLFHNVSGALAGLATNISPVTGALEALGMMGINVLPMLGSSLGALAPRVLDALKGLLPTFLAAGAEEGTVMGTAAGTTAVAVEGPIVAAGQAAVAAEATPAAAAGGTAIGTAMATSIGTALTVGAGLAAIGLPLLILAKIKEGLPHGDATTNGLPIGSGAGQWNLFGDVPPAAKIAGATAGADLVGDAARAAYANMPTLTDIFVTGGQKVGAALSGPFQKALDSMMNALGLEAAGFNKKWSELDAIASGAVDDIYGKIIRADNLASNTRAINAERDIINSKKSTAQQVADAKARIDALQQEGLKIKIEMAGRGELSAKAYQQLIDTLALQAKSNNAEVRTSAQLALDELAKLKGVIEKMPQVKYSGQGGGGVKHNAAGGYLGANQVSWVGEQGPELDVFANNGYILTHQEALAIAAGKYGPSSQGGGTGGGPLIGQQIINGIQPDDVERQTRRALRRRDLEMSLAGHG